MRQIRPTTVTVARYGAPPTDMSSYVLVQYLKPVLRVWYDWPATLNYDKMLLTYIQQLITVTTFACIVRTCFNYIAVLILVRDAVAGKQRDRSMAVAGQRRGSGGHRAVAL